MTDVVWNPVIGIPGRDPTAVEAGRAAADLITERWPGEAPWSRDELTAVLRSLAGLGYLGSTIGPGDGGAGLTLPAFASLLEGLSARFPFLSGHSVQRSVATSGTDRARREPLPALLTGERVGAIAVTEPHGGSALSDVRTRLVPQGDGYLLTGTKDWVTHGGTADLALVLAGRARTDGEVDPVRVLIDLTAPGVTRTSIPTAGLRRLTFASLDFDAVPVEAWRILRSDGVEEAKTSFAVARVLVAVQAVGRVAQAFGDVVWHLRTRTARGRPVTDTEVVRRDLGRLGAELTALRLLVYHAVAAVAANAPGAAALAGGAKAHVVERATRTCSELISLAGGHGLHRNHGVTQARADLEMLSVADGTELVNSVLLGRLVGSA